MDPGIVGGIISGIGSIFGGGDDPPDAFHTNKDAIWGRAKGARDAGKKHGFNPLTLLQTTGTLGPGTVGGGQPPLASALQAFGGFITEQFGDEAQDRKEHNRLQTELLRLQVDKARTLAAVAPVSAVAAMAGPPAAITGRNAVGIVNGTADAFLNETDRNPAVADERDNTVSYQSHGQQTLVPVGPDFDEVMTGLFIDANNRRKARLEREARSPGMTKGSPLTISSASQGAAGLLPLPYKHAPSGYTEDGRPFWSMPDGSIRWEYPFSKGN